MATKCGQCGEPMKKQTTVDTDTSKIKCSVYHCDSCGHQIDAADAGKKVEAVVEDGHELSVPERHQKKIAIDTLRMNDVGANIMGGMTKAEARAFLAKIGYSAERIAAIENESIVTSGTVGKLCESESQDIATLSVEEAARQFAGNWQKMEDFAWDYAGDEDAGQWGLYYTHNRDSGLLDQANAQTIAKEMEPFEQKGEVRFEIHNHWAVYHVDGIALKAIGEDGEPTDAFRAFYEIMQRLADYAVLDEQLYSKLEYDAAVENITEEGKSMVKDGIEDWAGQVFSWLRDNNPSEVENTDDRGAYPSREAIKDALIDLDLIDPSELDDEEDAEKIQVAADKKAAKPTDAQPFVPGLKGRDNGTGTADEYESLQLEGVGRSFFYALAKAIKDSADTITKEEFADIIALLMSQQNPNFDYDRFMDAAMGSGQTEALSRKDFIAWAGFIRNYDWVGQYELVEKLCDFLATQNSQFDADRFKRACGVELSAAQKAVADNQDSEDRTAARQRRSVSKAVGDENEKLTDSKHLAEGPGVRPEALRSWKRRTLAKYYRQLQAAGVHAELNPHEVAGDGWELYVSYIGQASNGEVFFHVVIKIGSDIYSDIGQKTAGRFKDGLKLLTAKKEPSGLDQGAEDGMEPDYESVTFEQALMGKKAAVRRRPSVKEGGDGVGKKYTLKEPLTAVECWNFTDDSKHTIPAGTEITLEYSQDADNTIVSTEGIETADGRTAYRFIVPNEKLTKVTGAKIVGGYDDVGNMMAWEAGELDDDQTVELFQHLIDSGLVWQLQGAYGRSAAALIKQGYCTDLNGTMGGKHEGRKHTESQLVEIAGADQPDQVSQMMAYEQGDLSDEETVELFQHLIDSGLAWKLQGSYGRTAAALIKQGVCHEGQKHAALTFEQAVMKLAEDDDERSDPSFINKQWTLEVDNDGGKLVGHATDQSAHTCDFILNADGELEGTGGKAGDHQQVPVHVQKRLAAKMRAYGGKYEHRCHCGHQHVTEAIAVGSMVKYSAAWLRSTGQYTGDICFAKGKVTELRPMAGGKMTLAVVEWDKPDLPNKINVKNLTPVGKPEPFEAVTEGEVASKVRDKVKPADFKDAKTVDEVQAALLATAQADKLNPTDADKNDLKAMAQEMFGKKDEGFRGGMPLPNGDQLPPTEQWDVYMDGDLINTIPVPCGTGEDEVKNLLIAKGYETCIVVRKKGQRPESRIAKPKTPAKIKEAKLLAEARLLVTGQPPTAEEVEETEAGPNEPGVINAANCASEISRLLGETQMEFEQAWQMLEGAGREARVMELLPGYPAEVIEEIVAELNRLAGVPEGNE